MPINLLTTVQKNLGYPELKKIDPNTQRPDEKDRRPNRDRMTQVVVPAVLAGIYKLAKSEEGINQIVSETGSSNWVQIIFGAGKDELLKNASAFTYYDSPLAEQAFNEAAAESIKVIRENTKAGENLTEVKNFIANQRNNILPYLPADLHIGNLLEDTTIDDRTNKMQGPLSSLMHKIETGFSGHETQEDADRKSNSF